MTVKKSDNAYPERYYIKAIQNRIGNLFTRMEELEKSIRKIHAGDVTQLITNVISQDVDIVLPFVLGATSDPTDPTFSGVVLRKAGQLINGQVYTFAIVIDGVVWTGAGGDTGTPVIVGGGDVYSDTTTSTVGFIPQFSSTDGKHITDNGVSLNALSLAGGVPLFLDNATSGIYGKQLTTTLTDSPTTLDTALTTTSLTTIGEFTSDPIGTDALPAGSLGLDVQISADASAVIGLLFEICARTPAGVITVIESWSTLAAATTLTTTPTQFLYGAATDGAFPFSVSYELDALDSILFRIKAQDLSASRTVKIHLNDNDNASYIKVPFFPASSSSGSGLTHPEIMARVSIGF